MTSICHQIISSVPMFVHVRLAGLSKKISECVTLHAYPKGEWLARKGSISIHMHFVTSGCLKKIQQLQGDEKIDEFVSLINNLYPSDIVEYYSPNFHNELLKKLETV